MDVMNPELMWIDGICYRISDNESFSTGLIEQDEYDSEGSYPEKECIGDEPCNEFEIEVIDGKRYRTAFHVARSYFPFIIGAKGATRRRLENETKTQIQVPRQEQDGDIIITGADKRGISAARRRINLIVMSARHTQSFTHFLSLPLTGNVIKERFSRFKAEVLETCKDRGITASIFQLPEKLHLTIGTLVLSDTEERKKAAELLVQCKERVIDPILQQKPLRVKMIGVEYMNDDPEEVDVLYGKIEPDGSCQVLQNLTDGIVNFFTTHGLMEKQNDQVKLHATVMNTLFRKEAGGVCDKETSRRRQRTRESFNASHILKIFEAYDFGEQTVDTLHLSQRYTTSNTGYYQSSCTISLT